MMPGDPDIEGPTMWPILPATILLACVISWLSGCALPTTPTDIDATVYWEEAEDRLLNWLYIHQECGWGGDAFRMPRVTVVRGNVPTCTYDDDERKITIGIADPGACMPHELGHAALEQVGNRCWRDYEHDRIAPPRPKEEKDE